MQNPPAEIRPVEKIIQHILKIAAEKSQPCHSIQQLKELPQLKKNEEMILQDIFGAFNY